MESIQVGLIMYGVRVAQVVISVTVISNFYFFLFAQTVSSSFTLKKIMANIPKLSVKLEIFF